MSLVSTLTRLGLYPVQKVHEVTPEVARRRRNVDRLDSTAAAGYTRFGQSIFMDALGILLTPGQQYAVLQAMREAVPLLDAGLIALRQITGLPKIVTGEDATEHLIKDDFLDSVHVGEAGIGYDTYIDVNRDNALHYGFSVSEMVPGPGFHGIERLKVTDSRTFVWKKEGKHYVLFQKPSALAQDEIRVDFTWSNYWAYETRGGHPQGYSALWKLDFPVDIALRILHAASKNWERMGDPSLWLKLKADVEAIPSPEPDADGALGPAVVLQKRLDGMMGELRNTLAARKEGRIRDFGFAIAKEEEVELGVLGEPSKLMDPKQYWDMVLDQMVSKLGVPAWLLGIHRGTTERLSSNEVQMLTSRIDSRRRDEEPLIRKEIALAFALLGRPDTEFEIEWEGPTLDDRVETARADLMEAQAEAIRARLDGGGQPAAPAPGQPPAPGEPAPEEGVGVGAGGGDGNGNRLAALERR